MIRAVLRMIHVLRPVIRILRLAIRFSCALGLMAALDILSGCAVGPDYEPPAPADGADAPLISRTPTAETTAEPPDDWWHLYHDALLDRLLQQAFTANADLKAAEANLSAARALLEAAKSGRYPQTKAEAAGTYGRDPVTEEILELGGHRPENLWVFDALLDVSYEIDLFGHVRRSVEASRADTRGQCRRARRHQGDGCGRDRAGLCANLRARRTNRRGPSFPSTWSAAKPRLPCAVTKPAGTRSSMS